MNSEQTHQAALSTIKLAVGNGMHRDETLSAQKSFQHINWMAEQMETHPLDKASRWLGWLQAVVYCTGYGTFEEMKEINKQVMSVD